MTEKNGARAWGVALFLAGLVVAGFAGMLRGDWLGREAAEEVKIELVDYHDKDIGYMKEDLREIKEKLDQLLEIQR